MQGPTAEVLSPLLEQVVGDEDAGNVLEQPPRHRAPAAPPREHREAEQAAPGNGQQLAVEHGAGGQRRTRRDDVGEGLVDELLAAAPDGDVAATSHQLRPHAVPLPLGLPVGDAPERGDVVLLGAVERRGEEEGIGPAVVRVVPLGREQPAVGLAIDDVTPHEPMRHHRGLDPRHLRERAGDERA